MWGFWDERFSGEGGLLASCREGGTVSRHAGCTLNSIIEMASSPVVLCSVEEMEGDGEEEQGKT